MKKILGVLLITALLIGRVPAAVYAEDITPAPENNTTTTEQTTTTETTPPAPQTTQTGPEQTSGPSQPNKPAKPNKPEKPDKPNTPNKPETPSNLNDNEQTPLVPLVENKVPESTSDGSSNGGNVGDTTTQTGDANSNGNINNTGNTNASINGCATCGGSSNAGGVSIVNEGNGTNSNNNSSATIANDTNTNQNNSANIVNNSQQSASTGHNDSSKNVGDTTIITGDANASTTLLTGANTNIDGIAVSEFDIADDHVGDYVLDFGANCVSGCTNYGGVNVANVGNGADSTNNGSINNIGTTNTNQNNEGSIENNVNLSADSGHNEADKNTGGDNTIVTGNANVAANLINLLNNNIAGNVAYGVVNIFGNLIGDIILPDNVFDQLACSTCGGNTNVVNSGNGTGSNNNGTVNNTSTDNLTQANIADISNNIVLSGQTGDNSTSKNTNGDNSITTGTVNLDASVLNIANMNLMGSNMWLVFINDAGNWVGQLFGADANGNMAGSPGVQFAVDPNGSINVINANNGADSTNTGEVNNTSTDNTTQTNDAKIVNNVNLSANTGGNSADKNTGGNNSITTGDAQAIANIVNFVNNNISGGKLLVTFVNVFGNWKGDFLTPGSHKDSTPLLTSNGENNNNNSSSNNNGSESSSASSASADNNSTSFLAAGGTTEPSTITPTGSVGISEVKVAGVNNVSLLAGISKEADPKKSVELNLAWLLFALPVLAGAIMVRKYYVRRTA